MIKKYIVELLLLFSLVSAQTVENHLANRFFQTDNEISVVCSNFFEDQLLEFDRAAMTVDQISLDNVAVETLNNTDLPINIFSLIDVSKTVFETEKELPKNLIHQFINDSVLMNRTRLGIISFGSTVNSIQSLTNDGNKVEEALNQLNFDSKTSDFSFALLETLKLIDETKTSSPVNNQIILITDGAGYNDAKISEKQIAEALFSSGVSLNVIVTRNTNTSSYEEFDFNRLNRLASNSGGIALKTDTGDSAENYKAKIVESILQTRIIHGELPADFSLSSDAKSEILLTLYHQNEEVFRTSQFVQLAQKMATERTKDVTQHIDLLTDTPVEETNNLNPSGVNQTPEQVMASIVPVIQKTRKDTVVPTFVLNQSETDEVVHSDLSEQIILSPNSNILSGAVVTESPISPSETISQIAIVTQSVTDVPMKEATPTAITPTDTPTNIPTNTAVKTDTPAATKTLMKTATPIVTATTRRTATPEILKQATETVKLSSLSTGTVESTTAQSIHSGEQLTAQIETTATAVNREASISKTKLEQTNHTLPDESVNDGIYSDSRIKTAEYTLKDFGYTTDVEYRGVLVSHQYDINLPKNWTFSSPFDLIVNFSHSNSLNSKSSLAADWNGIRLTSVLLDDSNAENGSLSFRIPTEQINPGYNKLSFQFYMGIRDDFCEDFDNPAVWAVIHNSTAFRFDYTVTEPKLDLYKLPSSLIDPSPILNNRINLVLPDKPSVSEINAAALVSAKLGQIADWNKLELEVFSLDQLSITQPLGNIIYIGNAKSLLSSVEDIIPDYSTSSTEELTFKNLDGTLIEKDSGVFWLQTSSFDSKSIAMTITGDSPLGLQKAAEAFATTSVFDRLSGRIGIVVDTPASDKVEKSINKLVYSLDDLGYKNIVAEGNRQQSVFLNLPLQMAFDSLGEAALHLIYSHSAIENAKNSYMDVSVNSVPVKRIALNSHDSENTSVVINIPLKLFKLGDNTVEITSNIQADISNIQSTLYCTEDYYSNSWLTINPDSSFTFPSGTSQLSANLSGFPQNLISSSSLTDLALIIPDTVDWAAISTTIITANRIGRVAEGDQLFLKVFSASDQSSERFERSYQILIGLPSNNAAIKDLNDLLPVSFDTEGVKPKFPDSMAAVYSSSGKFGFIESILTEAGKFQLILTANSQESLEWVSKVIDNPEIYKNFTGNLQVISGENETASFTIPGAMIDKAIQDSESTQVSGNQLLQKPDWVVILTAAILFISLTVITVAWINKRR
jgi:hypothetical protein